ncbi:phosphatidylserine decarboxylase 1, partial [Linderina pennispora]
MNSVLARGSLHMAAGSAWRRPLLQRPFASARLRHYSTKQQQSKDSGDSRTWYWIPVGVGLTYIAFQRLYHIEADLAEDQKRQQQAVHGVAVAGPWQLHVLSALPLKAMSRLFGSFNELEIPGPLRTPLLRLYAWVFGCNLGEMKDPELRNYPNLATFFYRELCDGARPVDAQAAVVSPSDGKILHYGVVEQRKVEQVKGMTYSLDAFLGAPDVPATHGHAGITEQTM